MAGVPQSATTLYDALFGLEKESISPPVQLGDVDGLEADACLRLGVWCLRLYVQSEWTGPENFGDELTPVLTDRAATKELSVDGELFETKCTVPGAMFLARKLLVKSAKETRDAITVWWQARSAVAHHRSLIGGVRLCLCPSLRREVLTGYVIAAQSFGLIPDSLNLQQPSGMSLRDELTAEAIVNSGYEVTAADREYLILELYNVFAMYGYGQAFRDYLQSDVSTWPYKISLEGKLGLRRVHQQDPIPQLCVTTSAGTGATTSMNTTSMEVPRSINLDELDAANDILARPKFVDDAADESRSLPEKFYMLAWANQQYEEAAVADELSANIIRTITEEILHDSSAKLDDPEAVTAVCVDSEWSLRGSALFLRSRAEFRRSKLKERSCLQILALERLNGLTDPGAHERLRYIWLTTYPNKWELRRDAGKKFKAIGAPLTARDMYAKMEMWPEVIDCLLMVNRRNEAREVLESELKNAADSAILWLLRGQVESDPTYLTRAWELSNGKYYKAAESLADYYTKIKPNREKAIEWLTKALEIQPYHPDKQFTFGCLLMQDNKFKRALSAFNAVTAHDDEHFEAWANMGAIHAQLEQWQSAKKCLQAAARKAQNRWRIWDSYVKVCFKLNEAMSAFEGLEHMLDLNAADQIQIWMLHRLTLAVLNASPAPVKNDFASRVLAFFRKYFVKLAVPIPSRRNSLAPQNVFDTEPIRTCVDRYRIWAVLTSSLHLKNDACEISLKAGHELMRIVEDCMASECPRQLWSEHESYDDFASALVALWERTVNELTQFSAEAAPAAIGLTHYADDATPTSETNTTLEGARDVASTANSHCDAKVSQFRTTSAERLATMIQNCALISLDHRRVLVERLGHIISDQ